MSWVSSFIIPFLIIPTTSGDTITLKNLEAATLMQKLEKAFCEINQNGAIVSEVEARVCYGVGQSRDICSIKDQLKSCLCAGCVACCQEKNGICQDSANFGIFENAENVQWYRQNQLEGCQKLAKRQSQGIAWTLCSEMDDGKICDLVRMNGSQLEFPKVCRQGHCQLPDCSIFSNPDPVVRCPCSKKQFNQYVCCKSLNNNNCLPYTQWLLMKKETYKRYLDASRSACDDSKKCDCPADGAQECQKCCKKDDGTCQSLHQQNTPWFLKPQGTSCANNKGICTNSGECKVLNNFCSDPKNQNKLCGSKEKCTADKSCIHVCGSENNECICNEPFECQLCCRNPQNISQCRSVYTTETPTALIRDAGSPCQLGKNGICTETGTCKLPPQKRQSGGENKASQYVSWSLLNTLNTFFVLFVLCDNSVNI